MENIDTEIVHSFSKGGNETVQLALKHFKGKQYIDLRIWFHGSEDMTLHPTKKGIYCPLEYLDELRLGLERLAKSTAKNRNQDKVVIP